MTKLALFIIIGVSLLFVIRRIPRDVEEIRGYYREKLSKKGFYWRDFLANVGVHVMLGWPLLLFGIGFLAWIGATKIAPMVIEWLPFL